MAIAHGLSVYGAYECAIVCANSSIAAKILSSSSRFPKLNCPKRILPSSNASLSNLQNFSMVPSPSRSRGFGGHPSNNSVLTCTFSSSTTIASLPSLFLRFILSSRCSSSPGTSKSNGPNAFGNNSSNLIAAMPGNKI